MNIEELMREIRDCKRYINWLDDFDPSDKESKRVLQGKIAALEMQRDELEKGEQDT